MKDCKKCKKCKKNFKPAKGLINYCSVKCSHSRIQTEEVIQKKSFSAKNSLAVKTANAARKIPKIKKVYITRKIPRIKKICVICLKEFWVVKRRAKIAKYCSNTCVNLDNTLRRNNGGYRVGSGRGKSGWYQGYFCYSSYELAYVVYNIDHQIHFKRNWKGFPYVYNGKEYKYYPDFIENKIYVEIKGFIPKAEIKKEEEKRRLFPKQIQVISGSEGNKVYLDYIKNKHGKDFIKLYEKQTNRDAAGVAASLSNL